MAIQESELVHWRELGSANRRRWDQIRHLSENANKNNADQAVKDLAFITTTDFLSIQGSGDEKVEIFADQLSEAIRRLYRQSRENLTLVGLTEAVRNPTGQEIPVNCTLEATVPVFVGPFGVVRMGLAHLLARKYPSEIVSTCSESIIEGIFLGTEDALRVIERPRTLLRVFTREYFVGRGEILPDPCLGAVVIRPTRYRGVDLRYQYDPNQVWPYMNLVVNRIPVGS